MTSGADPLIRKIGTFATLLALGIAVTGCGEGMTRGRVLERAGKRVWCGGHMFVGGIQVGSVLLFDAEASLLERDEECVRKLLADGFREVPDASGRR